MTTFTKIPLPLSMVFVEESLDVIICNSLSIGDSYGIAGSKSNSGSELVLVDESIMVKNCFQNFTIIQCRDK